jgi:UDPglucose--hexose-1-phosphate uridylyltransferase
VRDDNAATLYTGPHRRFNPLTGEWVLVSPQRAGRPWLGQVEPAIPERRVTHDPECYLCPGNARAGGQRNPHYESTFVFDNDFPALTPGDADAAEDGLLIARSEPGRCRVVCFSPRHDLTLAEMDPVGVRRVVEVWRDEYSELGRLPYVGHVQIFENKGEAMGCSNPHPHGQIWAQRSIPAGPAREGLRQQKHLLAHGTTLLADYLSLELHRQERIVLANDSFVALVPYWATWPFETMILGRRPLPSLAAMTEDEITAFADAIRRLTVRYDNLFGVLFPYSAGIHQAPTDGEEHLEWQLHMHFYPPLLSSATVKKFMVGYEMLAEAQRDITPEMAAAALRDLFDGHLRTGR